MQWLRVYLVSSAGEVELSTLATTQGYRLMDGVRGFGIPKRTVESSPIASGDGSIFRSQRFDESEMMLPVAVRGQDEDDVAELTRALEKVLVPASDSPVEIRVEAPNLGTVRRRRAYYVEGLEGALGGQDQHWHWRHMQLKLNALDPVWFGQDRIITNKVKTQRKPFISSVDSQQRVNLLPNPSFEDGLDQDGFPKHGGRHATFELDTSWAGDGGQSVKMTPDGGDITPSFEPSLISDFGDRLGLAKALGLVAGNTYTVGATIRLEEAQSGESDDPSELRIQVAPTANNGDIINSDPAPNEPGEHRVHVSFTFPEGSKKFRIMVSSGSTEIPVWVDQLTVEEGETDGSWITGDATVPTTIRTNLQINPGMESGTGGYRTPSDLVTLDTSTDEKVSGEQSLEVEVVDTSDTPGFATDYYRLNKDGYGEGIPVTCGIMAKATNGVGFLRFQVWDRRTSFGLGTTTSSVNIKEVVLPVTGEWQRIEISTTTPKLLFSGTAPSRVERSISFRWNLIKSVGGKFVAADVGEKAWFDECLVEKASVLGDYFDGDSEASGKEYSWNDDGTSIESAKSTTGSVPFFPIRLSGSNVVGTYALDIGGDLPTWGTYTITGPGDDPTLTHGEDTFYIAGRVDEPITVDMNPGIADIYTDDSHDGEMWGRVGQMVGGEIIESDFWQLEPGQETIGMTMVNASNLSSIRVMYTERWLAAY